MRNLCHVIEKKKKKNSWIFHHLWASKFQTFDFEMCMGLAHTNMVQLIQVSNTCTRGHNAYHKENPLINQSPNKQIGTN
jgi:hypothetical protein